MTVRAARREWSRTERARAAFAGPVRPCSPARPSAAAAVRRRSSERVCLLPESTTWPRAGGFLPSESPARPFKVPQRTPAEAHSAQLLYMRMRMVPIAARIGGHETEVPGVGRMPRGHGADRSRRGLRGRRGAGRRAPPGHRRLLSARIRRGGDRGRRGRGREPRRLRASSLTTSSSPRATSSGSSRRISSSTSGTAFSRPSRTPRSVRPHRSISWTRSSSRTAAILTSGSTRSATRRSASGSGSCSALRTPPPGSVSG